VVGSSGRYMITRARSNVIRPSDHLVKLRKNGLDFLLRVHTQRFPVMLVPFPEVDPHQDPFAGQSMHSKSPLNPSPQGYYFASEPKPQERPRNREQHAGADVKAGASPLSVLQ